MGLFIKKGLVDIIRCDEPSYLIWKWHPKGYELGKSNRENSIRFGSSLRVKDGEVAVFVYKQKNGLMQDYIVGPYDEKIKTENFPILASIYGLALNGGSPFQAEVYFINLAEVIQTKFVVPFFDVSDPRYPDFTVPVAVRGTISFKITDYKHFIKCHRLINFDLKEFQSQIADLVSRYTKDAVINAPAKCNIPVVTIESNIATINDIVELNISDRLSENFGVTVTGVDISAIEVDKTSLGYKELMAITKDISSKTIQAKSEADIENYRETLKLQRSATKIKIGTDAFSIVGDVIGDNTAKILSSMPENNRQPSVPPTIPVVKYYVAKDDNATGPYDVSKLREMALLGELKSDSLVWKYGMAEWQRADSVEELVGFFPPKIPK